MTTAPPPPQEGASDHLANSAAAERLKEIETLRRSEARYRAIVEDQSEMVSLALANGQLLYVNQAYCGHFGLTRDEMVGVNLLDFVTAADREIVAFQIAEVFRTGTSQHGDNRMVAADGRELWVAWTNRVQRDGPQQVVLHSVGRDVTDRKLAELALRASQSLLARTGRVAGVGGWELDIQSEKITWSDETRRIHEVGSDYLPTLEGAIHFYAPEARAVVQHAVELAFESGTPWDLELPLITATGRPIWVRAVGEAEFENGAPVRLVGAFQDITLRKQLERRLADSENFVRQVTDGLPVRIAYIDREGRYQFVNKAHCQRFGREREAIIGRTRSELVQSSLQTDDQVHMRVNAVLAGQPQRFEFDDMLDGEMRKIDSQLTPDFSESGEVRGFFSTGVDITERTAAEKALKVLTTVFDNTTDFVVQTNWRGRVTYMNPAVRYATGLTLEDPVDLYSFSEFNTPATNRQYKQVILPAVQSTGVWVGESVVYTADRKETLVSHMVIAHRDSRGRIGHYSAIMRDISAEVGAKQQLLRQTDTLKSVIEAIPAVVAVVGADGRYRFVNSAFERWQGVPREHIVGRSMSEVLGQPEYEHSRAWIDHVLAGETVAFEKEYAGRGGPSHMAISLMPLRSEKGEVDGFICVAQDITGHKLEEVRLLNLTQSDPLTGLLNRSGFQAHLERRINEGGGASLALLYIDLDYFKPVNDTHGHAVGDQLLQAFAQRLLKLVRPTDAVARLGGDEFAIALSSVRMGSNAKAVADKVILEAKAPFDLGPLNIRMAASVGVAFGVDTSLGWKELVERADAMLYEAKRLGRGRHVGVSTRTVVDENPVDRQLEATLPNTAERQNDVSTPASAVF